MTRPAARVARTVIAAVGAGAVVLLLSSLLATVAILAVLPATVDPALRWRLPLLLAGAALGGRWRIEGDLAGQVSPFNDGGLFGPPRAPGDGAGHLVITATPTSLSALSAIAVALVVHRGLRGRRLCPREWVGAVFGVAAGTAGLGAVVATVGRTGVSTGTVRVPLLWAAAVGAGLGLLAAAAGGWSRVADLWPTAYRAFGPGLRTLGAFAGLTCAAAVPIGLTVAVAERSSLLGIITVGHPLSPQAAAILAVLVVPTLAFHGIGLVLGSTVRADGVALNLHAGRTVTLATLIHLQPLAAFGPLLGVALLTVATLIASRVVSPASLPARVVGAAVTFAAAGVLARYESELALRQTLRGQTHEALSVLTPLPSALWPAVWGLAAALIGPWLGRALGLAPRYAGRGVR